MSEKTRTKEPPRNKQYPSCVPDSNFDITRDELDRISEALKKEEFRKMFCDYIEEIQDPENRKIYEEEVAQFERERGVNVRFVHPEAGFVVKTSENGKIKCFINIAQCKEVGCPSSQPCYNEEKNERGFTWSIPLAQGQPHDDFDNKRQRCRVYDVVFHPDSLSLAEKDSRFRKLLIDTALDAVEREFKVTLDRTNLKFPKLDYKGLARATVIRTLDKNATPDELEPHPLEHLFPEKPTEENSKPKVIPLKKEITKQPEFSTPKYIIKHRRGVDLAEYTHELDAKLNVTMPKELVVEIDLPMLRSTAECQLDVTDRRIYLISEKPGAKYRVNIDLPYDVNDKDGTAKFDTDKRRLIITLPVIQPNAEKQRAMHETLLLLQREDSGVECTASGDELQSPVSSSPVGELSDLDENENEDEEDEDEQEKEGVNNNKDKDKIDLSKQTKLVQEITPEEALDLIKPKPTAANFLKSSVEYMFPSKFDCNMLEDVLSYVLHVRNVQPESISILKQNKSIHLQFISIGSGYFPTHFAFYLQLPEDATKFQIVTAEAEAWENNVVLNVSLNAPGESLEYYLAGLDKSDIKEYMLEKHLPIKNATARNRTKSLTKSPPVSLSSSLDISVERSDCEKTVEIEIKPHLEQNSTCANNTTEDEDNHQSHHDGMERVSKKLNKRQRKRQKKRRSLSESACDDLKAFQQREVSKNFKKEAKRQLSPSDDCNETSAVTLQQRKQRSFSESRDTSSGSSASGYKGILKHYSRYDKQPSISDSCSSIDDLSSYGGSSIPSSLMFSQSFSGIPEENSSELSESCKKTVRFSDIIHKQVFRLDSSILGQRKKNQKRRDRKLRAMERRLSEGDSVDYEDNNNKPPHRPKTKGLHFKNKNKLDKHKNKHESGSDMDEGAPNNNQRRYHGRDRARFESESSQDADHNKNAMMFEMDM